VDGQFKGTFPVGSVMPIVTKNNAEITVYAGIKTMAFQPLALLINFILVKHII